MSAPAIMDRETFLANRMTGVGGSDAGTICGLNPYRTLYDLWLEKTGQQDPADLSDKEAVIWGNLLEPKVAERFEQKTGKRVRRNNRTLRHPDHDFMIAHIDREIVGESAILECKTVGRIVDKEVWGESGSDKVPESYLTQCMHYLAVTNKQTCYLAVLIGGQDFRIYIIERDQELIDDLILLESAFWKHVQDKTEPPFIGSTAALATVKRMFPGTNGDSVKLTGDALSAHSLLISAKERAKIAKADEDSAKSIILKQMGEAAIAILPDGSGYTRKEVTRGAHEVKESTYVDFRHIKKATA